MDAWPCDRSEAEESILALPKNAPILPYVDYHCVSSVSRSNKKQVGGTNISDAKTRFGLEEYIEERFASSSIAEFESFNITMVCPSTVIELTGPRISWSACALENNNCKIKP